MTSSSPLNRLLEKVGELISSLPRKEKEEKNEKHEHPVKPAEKKEKGSSNCPHHFGYLADRPKSAPIPPECLICPNVLKCMAK